MLWYSTLQYQPGNRHNGALVRPPRPAAYYATPDLNHRPRASREMSKVCAICGKKPSFGNNRSHSMRATPRRWDPNVQKVRIKLDGKPTQAYVCAKCLKAHKVEKVA